jgi:hypothetical protein
MVCDTRHALLYVGQFYQAIRIGMAGMEVPQRVVDRIVNVEHRRGIVASMGDTI